MRLMYTRGLIVFWNCAWSFRLVRHGVFTGTEWKYIYGTRKVFHGRYTVSNVAPCKHLTSIMKYTTIISSLFWKKIKRRSICFIIQMETVHNLSSIVLCLLKCAVVDIYSFLSFLFCLFIQAMCVVSSILQLFIQYGELCGSLLVHWCFMFATIYHILETCHPWC